LEMTDRQQSGWLRSQDIEQIPCSDLHTIDKLWARYSEGRFGFSTQREIWLAVGGQPGQFQGTTFYKFGDRVGWRVNSDWLRKYEDFTFTSVAPKGHLPSLRFPGAEEQFSWFGLWEGSFRGFLSRIDTCLETEVSV
jgi:hypothetical protein